MAALRFGAPTMFGPPADRIGPVARFWEDCGFDFTLQGDQLNMMVPRSIWTPDIVPGARAWDIDAWYDSFLCAQSAVAATEKIEVGVISDALRRSPASLAQLALTLDHYSKGRFFLVLGAGEEKQFGPYGLRRDKPFAHLEESLKILRMFFERCDPIVYDGPIWKLDHAVIGLEPYDHERPPRLLVAGGPGRALRIAGVHGDGWLTFLPSACSPEEYAASVKELRQQAEAAGRDPDTLVIVALCMSLLTHDEAQLEELIANPAMRIEAAVNIPTGKVFRRWGAVHPLGDDFTYSRDFVPMKWSREDALSLASRVPLDVVRQSKFSGTPAQAAAQIQAYVEAGATHVYLVNYSAMVLSGQMPKTPRGRRNLMVETVDELRRLNGISPRP